MLVQESFLSLIALVTAAIGLITAVVEFKTKTRDAVPSARRNIIPFAIVALSFLIIFGVVFYSWRSDRFLNASLENHDPLVFHNLTRETYRVARFFPERTARQDEGNFGDVLKGVKRTLDVQSITATEILNDYPPAIKAALHGGLAIRFLLFDTKDEKNCEVLASSFKNTTCDKLRNMLEDSLQKLRAIHKDDPNGRLDVKLYKDVPLKTFWIKDGSVPSETVVQVQVFDPDKSRRASFRLGRLDDGDYARYLESQFNETWGLASSSVVELSQ